MSKSDIYNVDQSWHIKVMCEYCGFQMVVNNYPDKKSRTPKFFGLPICPMCDPRASTERWDKDARIVFPIKYRTCVAVVMLRKLMQIGPTYKPSDVAKIAEKASQFWDSRGNPVDQPEMVYETDRKIYGKVPVQD